MAAKYTAEEAKALHCMLAKGRTYAFIAKVLNRTEMGVAEYAQRKGLAPRMSTQARDVMRDTDVMNAVRLLCEKNSWTTRQVVDAATALGTQIIVERALAGDSPKSIAGHGMIGHSLRTIRDILKQVGIQTSTHLPPHKAK